MSPKKYLLVPMQPTPNGRLHIGHAAGAYLRADVIARHLKRAGHEVSVVTGSDVYENWILLDAHNNGRTPAETCWRFHDLIGEDLRSLGVGVDAWINPLDDTHTAAYRRVHEELVEALAASGAARKVADRTPRSSDSGRYVVGVWLLGTCPQCKTPGGGNACEECGYHYQPAEILDPRSRLDEGPLVWEAFESWYLQPHAVDDIVAAVERADVAPEFAAVAVTYLEQTKGSVRLSQPGPWGIASPLAGPEGVLSNPYYTYSLYCGAVHRDLTGAARNAFARDSDVTTVGLFGIDNAIGGVAVSHALAAAHGGLKPFDHMVTNHFLTFEGEKCSTSRKHGIWLHELFARTSVNPDELRHHLSHAALESGSDDFVVADFVAGVNRLRALVDRVERTPPGGAGPSGPDIERIVAAVEGQGRHLEPGRALSLPAAVAVLDDWLAMAADRPADRTLRTGLALLAEPLMPGLAQRCWAALGRTGRPSLAALTGDGSTADTSPAAPTAPLTADEVGVVSHMGSRYA